jgi:polyphosphate glucokinase
VKVTRILVIDVGGSHVKALVTGRRVPVKIPTGPAMTAKDMVRCVRKATAGWSFDAVSIGFPGPVVHGKPVAEPKNLGPGWVGFNFTKAFCGPVKIINDAAMQALGAPGGRMLFLGLSAGWAHDRRPVLAPMELAHLPYRKGRTYEEYIGDAGRKRLGKRKWRRHVIDVVMRFKAAFQADDVVVGGGNAKKLDGRLPGVRLGSNACAFLGGYRLWTRRTRRG